MKFCFTLFCCFSPALQGQQLRGIRGLFNRSSKASSDTNSTALRKRSISDHLLRRTASAPAKGRKKKSKMVLSESEACISDKRSEGEAGGGGGAEGTSGQDVCVEKRLQPRPPLIHRPMSMPLERLLQGQLSICSQDKEQLDVSEDTVLGKS